MTFRRSVSLIVLIFLVNVGLLLFYEKQLNGDIWDFPVDDAWIHMTFARNLAFGLGFGINPGESAAASTSVVWALWLALIHKLFSCFGMRCVVAAVKASGVLSAVMAIIAAAKLLKRFIPNDIDCFIAALLIVFSYPLAWGAISGMEVPLCAAFALWALEYQFSAFSNDSGPHDREISTAFWSLAFLVRPENFLFLCIAIAIFIVYEREKRFKLAMRLFAIAALCVVPFVAFHLALAGRPFPNTFTSKMSQRAFARAVVEMPPIKAAGAVLESLLEHLYISLQFLFLENPFVGLIYFAVPIMAWKSEFRQSTSPAVFAVIVMSFISLPLLAGAVGILNGNHFYSVHHGRYLPQTTLMAAFSAITIFYIFWNKYGRSQWIIVPLLFSLIFAIDREYELANDYARECKIIRQIHVSLGKWLNVLPKGLTVAVNDIGAMAYFGGQRLIDLVGLASPETNLWRRQGRIDLFLEKAKPDLLIIFPEWFPEIASRPETFKPIFLREVEDNITGGGNVKLIYRMPWSRGLPEKWPPLPPSDLPQEVPIPSLPQENR